MSGAAWQRLGLTGAVTTYRTPPAVRRSRAVPADWAVGVLAALAWLAMPAACGLAYQAVALP